MASRKKTTVCLTMTATQLQRALLGGGLGTCSCRKKATKKKATKRKATKKKATKRKKTATRKKATTRKRRVQRDRWGRFKARR